MEDGLVEEKQVSGVSGRSLPRRLEELARAPAVEPWLAPAAAVYGAGSYLRLLSFSMGLSARKAAAVPVISVGNLTVGGTGKTPVVIDLADRLSSHDLKVAILSRGYGRRGKKKVVLVSNASGSGPLVSVEEAGDEPFMMARAVPAALVLVGAKRIELARLAVEKYGAQVILLDDGFQHVQLRRDIDIVLFDFNDDTDSMALLPRGRLREPLAALGRAGEIVITKIPEVPAGQGDDTAGGVVQRLKRLRSRLTLLAPSAVLHQVRFAPSYLVSEVGKSSNVVKLSSLQGKKVFGLCGLARPDGFISSLEELGAVVADSMLFGDHHWYSAEDVAEIGRRFNDSRAEFIVTSEKDRVRLPLSEELEVKTYSLMIEPVWLDENCRRTAEPAILSRLSTRLSALLEGKA